MRSLSPFIQSGAAGLAVVAACLIELLPTAAAPSPPDVVPSIERPTHDDYVETIPGSEVRFHMLAIPGGHFRMGSPAGETSRSDDEGPQHLVRVRPFWMGKCEVTWDEYNRYRLREGRFASNQENEDARAMDADAITRPTQPYPDEYQGFGHEGYPVIGVSHHAAMEYCRWLSKQTGRAYRLPTEAEWEWACRAGTQTAYSFGDDPKPLGNYAWYANNSDEQTHPVGRKKPNRWGLHDIYGNVAEWCLDHYQKDFYAGFPAARLTIGPVKRPTADRFPHVARGGSWADPAAHCRSAARCASDKSWNKVDPHGSIWWVWNADFVGFRVVRAVEEQDDLKGIRSQVTRQSK
jgi:formylglycine-generating enzyme required for sulfatase activity